MCLQGSMRLHTTQNNTEVTNRTCYLRRWCTATKEPLAPCSWFFKPQLRYHGWSLWYQISMLQKKSNLYTRTELALASRRRWSATKYSDRRTESHLGRISSLLFLREHNSWKCCFRISIYSRLTPNNSFSFSSIHHLKNVQFHLDSGSSLGNCCTQFFAYLSWSRRGSTWI